VSFLRRLNLAGRNAPTSFSPAQLMSQVAKPSLTSGAYSGGLSLLLGANPIQALAAGAVDAGASAASLGLLRKLNPKSYGQRTLIDTKTGEKITQEITHPLETPLNVATSIGVNFLAGPLIYGGGQKEQISQQIEQRSLVNQTPINQQLVSPGTQFQMAGLPDASQFEQLLNQRGNWTQYLSPEDQALIAGVVSPRL
jgi:hypothetical protein